MGKYVKKAWRFSHPSGDVSQDVISVHLAGIPYSAILQQWTRHRSFAYSVESSRASELDTNFAPLWRTQPTGRMFSQKPVGTLRWGLADLVWNAHKGYSLVTSGLLKLLGLHKQHYQLPIKPHSTVSMVVTGNQWAWRNFLSLRGDESSAQADWKPIIGELIPIIRVPSHHPFDPNVVDVSAVYGRMYGPLLQYGVADWGPVSWSSLNENLCKAIASVARISSTGGLEPGKSPIQFVERLRMNGHWSPFEHFFHFIPPKEKLRFCHLTGAVTLRSYIDGGVL